LVKTALEDVALRVEEEHFVGADVPRVLLAEDVA
jgi:hypothetical protein